MLKKKQIIILLLLSAVPFVFYLQKPYLNGTDTYGYNSFNCNTQMQPHLVETLSTPFSQQIFKAMPCNTLIPKIVMWIIFFSVLVIFGLIGKLFDYDYGWLYGLFACLSPLFVSEFLTLEEMSFGYPLIFLSLYFTIKYLKGKTEWLIPVNNEHNKYYALLCVLIAGLFWKGAIIFLFVLGTIFPALIIIVLPITLLYGWNIVHQIIIPNVVESLPIYGWLFLFALNFFWFRIPRAYWRPLIPLIILFTISLKYTLFVVPFLLIGIAYSLNTTQKKQMWVITIVLVALTGLFTASYNNLEYPPTKNEVQVIKFAIQQADGNKICNDWSYGYWIYYYGGVTDYYAGGKIPDYNLCKGIIVTKKDEDVQADSLLVGNKLKVWKGT